MASKNEKISIIFLGTPIFAAKILDKLAVNQKIEIIAVITQADKPVGRKNILTNTPVKIIAQQHEIQVFQPSNTQELKEILRNFKPDFLLAIAIGMILNLKCLATPKIASINLHASLLPKYRGASPIQEALLNADKETGISIMKMSRKMDAGPIYTQKKIKIEEKDNTETLSKKMIAESIKVLPQILVEIKNGNLTAVPQNKSSASYCHKIKKIDGKVDFHKMTALEILNMIKAYKIWPGVFAEIKGKRIKIIKAEIDKNKITPGQIETDNTNLSIGTKAGSIRLVTLQPEGKKEMSIKDYINGYLKR